MADEAPFERFSGLSYDAFRRLALDPNMSSNERSGFPDSLRAGAEQAILHDFDSKLPALGGRGATVIDIGCGANALTAALIDLCRQHQHKLVLADSEEVLSNLRHDPGITEGWLHLVPGQFPRESGALESFVGFCDVVIAYSVLQYVFVDANVYEFLDAGLRLLAPGGRLLFGDLPNASMRRRFLASSSGRAFHREYTGRDDDPPVSWGVSQAGELDDGVLYGLVARARDSGYHAWLVPQSAGLPMANRREDFLCQRP